jgi:hypothetical protein
MKILVFDGFLSEWKWNPNHVLTFIAPEFAKKKMNTKQKGNKNEVIMHTNNAVYYHNDKTQEYFASQNNDEIVPSNLLFTSFTVWFLVLWLSKAINIKAGNHERQHGTDIEKIWRMWMEPSFDEFCRNGW